MRAHTEGIYTQARIRHIFVRVRAHTRIPAYTTYIIALTTAKVFRPQRGGIHTRIRVYASEIEISLQRSQYRFSLAHFGMRV